MLLSSGRATGIKCLAQGPLNTFSQGIKRTNLPAQNDQDPYFPMKLVYYLSTTTVYLTNVSEATLSEYILSDSFHLRSGRG